MSVVVSVALCSSFGSTYAEASTLESASSETTDVIADGTEAHPIGIDAEGNTLTMSTDVIKNDGEMHSTQAYIPSTLAQASDAETGSSPVLGTVIGTDQRAHYTNTTTFPNSAIVYITHNDAQFCTGWMVSKDTLVTAGHCVYSTSQKDWYDGLKFYPGANGSQHPYGVATATQKWTDVAYINSGDTRQDWGIVKLNRSVGSSTGWFGLQTQTSSYTGSIVALRGYPGDKTQGQLWGITGEIKDSQPNQLCYEIDTAPGQSGSPVFFSGSNNNKVIAIHTYGTGNHGSGGCATKYNAGTRITSSLYNIILDKKDE